MKMKKNETFVVVYNIIFWFLVGIWLYIFIAEAPTRTPGAHSAEAGIGHAIVIVFLAGIISLVPIPFSIYFLIARKHLSKTLFIISQLPFGISLLFWLTVLVACING